jgi:2-oxoglutarate dehydrogenase E1 component
MFHLLRRQALTKWRKPLIVFTPKSLLRHPKATSAITEFSSGRFEPVIHDDQLSTEEEKLVRRVLLCTGKAYYSLQQSREELGIRDVAIVRIEQLYPLSDGQLRQVLQRYPAKVPVLWVQEEPENMGAWRHFRARFGASLFGEYTFDCVARVESASPATGSSGSHRIEQEDIINRAFAPNA